MAPTYPPPADPGCACCPRPIEDDPGNPLPTRLRVLCNSCRARADELLTPGGPGDVVMVRGIGSTWIVGAST